VAELRRGWEIESMGRLVWLSQEIEGRKDERIFADNVAYGNLLSVLARPMHAANLTAATMASAKVKPTVW
jgi:hypothetical protein